MTTKPAPDWERIEQDHRAGVKTLREIADEQGITEGAIRKRAKRDGWERDLSGKVRAKADALVRKEAVRSTVRKQASEREIVDGNAAATAGVAIRHRDDLVALRDTAMAMLAEIRDAGEHQDTLNDIAKLLSENADGEADAKRLLDRLREALNRACSLPSRVTSFKAIVESIAKLVDAERTAWKLDDPANAGGGQRTMTDLEMASKLAYYVDMGRRRAPPPVEAPAPQTLQ